jgi:TRAP-type C4-dicarboxylate transport system substrate-binding protein
MLAAASFSANTTELTYKLTHVLRADTPSAMATERVAKDVLEKLEGEQFKIQILPAGQVGNDAKIVTKVKS